MTTHHQDDLSGLSMMELFRIEAENQVSVLTNGLLEIERGKSSPESFAALMRAAHSFKGAARIINLHIAVRIAHALEDCFVAAQQRKMVLDQPVMDLLFRGVDFLSTISRQPDNHLPRWGTEHAAEVDAFLQSVERIFREDQKPAVVSPPSGPPEPAGPNVQATQKSGSPRRPLATRPNDAASETQAIAARPATAAKLAPKKPESTAITLTQAPGATNQLAPLSTMPEAMVFRRPDQTERIVRLNADNLNRLLALAGESLVESRWLRPYADSFQRLKRHQAELAQQITHLRQVLEDHGLAARSQAYLNELSRQVMECQHFLAERIQELDMFDRRAGHLSQRLYLEVLRTRMRPFGEGVRRFPRMVRDLAKSLGKDVRLDVTGETTQVDRDILERLETPLAHLLRNAVDHGCEAASARAAAGKPSECLLRLEARHSAGMLLVTVTDDGQGVDLENVRQAIVERRLAPRHLAEKLGEPELLEFLFLPGFTLRQTVTEISGRGFGLDVVQNMVKSVRGAIRLSNHAGQGLRVQLQLPLTLSVLRALLVEVGGEPYAIPLSQIMRTLKLPRTSIGAIENRNFFHLGDQQVELLAARQVLGCSEPPSLLHDLPVVVLSDRNARYGLVVDRLLGERELVVQPLDPRLGKVKDISAAALMEDGSPVLIVEVEEMTRSIELLLASGSKPAAASLRLDRPKHRIKRVLAVDDSLTVRELQRKLLAGRGYHADVAVDGLEAWNTLRSGDYDLVITDVDMPRLNGIELAALIKSDPQFKSIPVLIVSQKDRDEDRLRGLEAGADYYLTKGSLENERLLQAVVDLIGEPTS